MHVSVEGERDVVGGGAPHLLRLARAVDRLLCSTESLFIGAGLAFTSLLLFVNVVLRYVFLRPIHWAEETTLYLMVWIVFVGGSVIIRTRGHIAVDVLPIFLSARNSRRLGLAVSLVSLVFLGALAYYGGQHTLRVQSSGQVMPAMQAPMWWAYLAVPVGSVLMFIRTLQHIVRLVRAGQASMAGSRPLGD
jgi:C4-dicarboxylate transporter DctQ subunit